MATDRMLYRREGKTNLIEIRLNSIHQLFDSFDPAPFPERSLDNEAEAYIIGSVQDLPLSDPIKLIFYLPREEMAATQTISLSDAIHNYFEYRLMMAQRQIRHYRRDARTTLAIGLGFLFACTALRQLVFAFGRETLHQIISEGLLIAGWVAMWRPLQALLYDWWPLHRTRAVFDKLKEVPVEVRPLEKAPAGLMR